MSRTLYDTGHDLSTPAAGHNADLAARITELAALVNEQAGALDRVVDPAGVGQAKGTIAKAIADADTAGGIVLSYPLAIADAASADYDIIVDSKIEVIDVIVHKRAGAGGAANTVQVKSTAAVISDVMSLNVAQDAVVRAGVITAANSVIVAGGKVRISVVKAGGNAACFVVVKYIKRP